MTSWSSFYPWILPHVRGCPQPQIDQALRHAARDFCNRSRAWEERAAAVTGDGTTSLRSFEASVDPMINVTSNNGTTFFEIIAGRLQPLYMVQEPV